MYNLYKLESKQYVIFQGIVYDVEEYLPTHPGGRELIEPELGTEIDEKFEEAEHTRFAKNLFNQLPRVGYLKGTEIKNSDKSRASGEAGVDGFELQSKYQFDYSKGLYY